MRHGTELIPAVFTLPGTASEAQGLMDWNGEPIPLDVAREIGWVPAVDVVGAGIYGGIVSGAPRSFEARM